MRTETTVSQPLYGLLHTDVEGFDSLAELALDMALNVLEPRGAFLVKVFHGEGFDQYRKALQGHFQRVVSRKPAASRPRSTEVYQLGSHLK